METLPDDLLSFKEFPLIQDNYNNSSAQLNIDSPKKSNIPNVSEHKDEDSEERSSKTHSFLSIEYYQQFFDVDTMTVVDRVATSMIPKRAASNYLKMNIGINPDLYGPTWIIITLIFTIAISGNMASYLQHAEKDYHWRYNFHLVSYTATTIILYSIFVPLALWAVLKWSMKADEMDLEETPYTPSLLSLICVYGYSLAVYIPVSVLWTVQISLVQWLLVMTGASLSGSVLVLTLMPVLRNSKYSFFLVISIAAAHFLLAAGFMLFFFHVPSTIITSHEAEKVITPTEAHDVVKKIVTVATNIVAANKTK